MKILLVVCLLAVYQVQAQQRATCEAIDCQPETGCTTTTFLCEPGYTCQEGSCVKEFPPGITCANVRCRSGYDCVEPAKCVKQKPIDVRCFTVECKPGYICVNGVCVKG